MLNGQTKSTHTERGRIIAHIGRLQCFQLVVIVEDLSVGAVKNIRAPVRFEHTDNI
jgi:hypothetical protein